MRSPQPSRPFRPGLPAGFVAGLIIGLLIGWFFHGVVGLVVRLGFVLILLIPLAIVLWFFFVRSRTGSASEDGSSGRMQVFTWRSGQGVGTDSIGAPPPPTRRDSPRDADAIDVEFEELKRRVDDEGTPR